MTAPPEESILSYLAAWARNNNAIKRSKIPIEKKVMAALLCISGYTSRDAAKTLGGISHVAVRGAYMAVSAALPPLQKKDRTVSIEENSVKLNETQQGVIWMARDADTDEILALRCSVGGSTEDGKKFIQAVLAVCNGRPLLRVGRGTAFPHWLRSLDLYFKIDTASPASSSIRQRISNFFRGSPSNPVPEG